MVRLKHKADVKSSKNCRCLGRLMLHRFSFEDNFPLRRCVQPAKQLQQRAFARTGSPLQRHELTAFQLEINVSQHRQRLAGHLIGLAHSTGI